MAFDFAIAELRVTVAKLVELHTFEVEAVQIENEKLKRQCEEPISDEHDISSARLRSVSTPKSLRSAAHEQDVVSECTEIDAKDTVGADPVLSRNSLRSSSSAFDATFRTRSPWVFDPFTHDISIFQTVIEEKTAARESVTRVILKLPSILEIKESESASRKHHRFILHPESKVVAIWMCICMLFLIYDLVALPISSCFRGSLFGISVDRRLDIAATIVWTADMIMHFFTGQRKKKDVEMRPAKIACLYMKSTFVFDLLLLIPDYVSLLVDSSSVNAVSILRVVRVRRFIRLMRLARMLRASKMKDLMQSSTALLHMTQAYFILCNGWMGASLFLVLIMHFLSCAWYALGDVIDDGWVSTNNFESASVGQAYAISMHWSFSRMHGLASPYLVESTSELFLEALLIYLSLILSACYTSLVVTIFMARVSSDSWRLWKLSAAYGHRHSISSKVYMRLLKFLDSMTKAGVRQSFQDEQALLQALPERLRDDLVFESRVHFLMVNIFLKDSHLVNSHVVFRICTHATQGRIFAKGEEIFSHGDDCYHMSFVTDGQLSYRLFDTTANTRNSRPKACTKQFPMIKDATGHMNTGGSEFTSKILEAGSSISEPVLWTEWTHVWLLVAILESMTLTLNTVAFADEFSNHRTSEMHAVIYARCFVRCLNELDSPDDLTAFDHLHLEQLDEVEKQARNLGDLHAHFMFLSHYKVEAGTEATLMRDHLTDILARDGSHPAHDFRSAIFIDSEDLTDLARLRQHVKMTTALVLLLTPGVLLRPWCLVELVTAVNENVRIVLVDIQRPGSQYRYPDEAFYADLLAGKLLPKGSVDLLQSEGFTLHDVEMAIRQAFMKIALPFSPHKTKNIREAELEDILKRCSDVDTEATASYTI